MARRMAGDVDVLRLLAEDRGGRDDQGRPMYLSDEDLGYDQYGMVENLSPEEIAEDELELRALREALTNHPDYEYVDAGQGPEYLLTPEARQRLANAQLRYIANPNLVPPISADTVGVSF